MLLHLLLVGWLLWPTNLWAATPQEHAPAAPATRHAEAPVAVTAAPAPATAAPVTVPAADVKPQGEDHKASVAPGAASPPAARNSQPADDAHKAWQEVKETASLHISLMTYGFTVLGVFTAILALAGLGITFFSSKLYKAELRERKNAIAKHEEDIKKLLAKAQDNAQSIENLAKEQGLTEKSSQDLLQMARDKVVNGKGMEVLWGKAILAQEGENWEKAYAFWVDILEAEPDNSNALFGAAVACYNIYDQGGKRQEDAHLLREATAYLERIPPAEQGAAAWSNMGLLLAEEARLAVHDPAARNKLWDAAEEKFQRAIEENTNDSDILTNWGNLLADRAKATEDDPAARNRYWDAAEGKYHCAIEENPEHSSTWSNWGALLVNRADATAHDHVARNQYWKAAEEKYQRATEENPQHHIAWNNWGILLLKRASCAPQSEKIRLWQQAEDVLHKAEEFGSQNALYNLACLAAQKGDIKTCMEYLERSHAAGKLPSLEHMDEDSDFDAMREIPEFKEFMEKLRGQ